MGFEPTRAEHIGLAVQRLNHSATVSPSVTGYFIIYKATFAFWLFLATFFMLLSPRLYSESVQTYLHANNILAANFTDLMVDEQPVSSSWRFSDQVSDFSIFILESDVARRVFLQCDSALEGPIANYQLTLEIFHRFILSRFDFISKISFSL